MSRKPMTSIQIAHKRAYDAARYERIGAEIRLRVAERYAANPQVGIRQAANWAAANPDRRRAIANSYKGRRRSVERLGISGPELAAWTAAQRKICFWCAAPCADNFEVDHFHPLARAGLHETENLVIACADCNRRKSSRDPFVFAAMIGKSMIQGVAA